MSVPRWLFVFLCTLGMASGCARTGSRNAGDVLPADFSIAELAAAELPQDVRLHAGELEQTTAVLAWTRGVYERGDRRLETWFCLVWQACQRETGGEVWILKVLFRHPRTETRPSGKDEWEWAPVSHSPQEGLRVYDTPPTLDDLYGLLHAADWDLDPPLFGYTGSRVDRILDSGFCSNGWRRTIGDEPSMPIPPEDPQVRKQREAANSWGRF